MEESSTAPNPTPQKPSLPFAARMAILVVIGLIILAVQAWVSSLQLTRAKEDMAVAGVEQVSAALTQTVLANDQSIATKSLQDLVSQGSYSEASLIVNGAVWATTTSTVTGTIEKLPDLSDAKPSAQRVPEGLLVIAPVKIGSNNVIGYLKVNVKL